MSEHRAKIGRKIWKIRTAMGLSQIEFGKRCGVAGPTVHAWEKGVSDIKSENLYNVAKVCRVTVDYLVNPNNDPNNEGQLKLVDLNNQNEINSGNIAHLNRDALHTIVLPVYPIGSEELSIEVEIGRIAMDASISSIREFVIPINDDSMSPMYPKETKFFVDVDAKPRQGLLAYSCLPDGTKSIRRITKVTPSGYSLTPFNDDYPVYSVDEHEFNSIIGVVTKALIQFI